MKPTSSGGLKKKVLITNDKLLENSTNNFTVELTWKLIHFDCDFSLHSHSELALKCNSHLLSCYSHGWVSFSYSLCLSILSQLQPQMKHCLCRPSVSYIIPSLSWVILGFLAECLNSTTLQMNISVPEMWRSTSLLFALFWMWRTSQMFAPNIQPPALLKLKKGI